MTPEQVTAYATIGAWALALVPWLMVAKRVKDREVRDEEGDDA